MPLFEKKICKGFVNNHTHSLGIPPSKVKIGFLEGGCILRPPKISAPAVGFLGGYAPQKSRRRRRNFWRSKNTPLQNQGLENSINTPLQKADFDFGGGYS